MSKIEVNTVDAQCGSTITVGSSGKNVKIEGNDIRSNDYKASDGGNIINQSGTTITLGASGDTVSLASGASQSGFGRSGSVNWQTGSIKTSTFTAANGEGYFINQSSAITANLPAGSAGAIVAFSDYARNFATYNLTISPNGSEKIGGVAADTKLDVDGQAATFVYVDSTKGWINVQNAEDTELGEQFIEATGGTIVTCGNFKTHIFTGPGTFCVSAVSPTPACNVADYLVVAAGGGGGVNQGGGGGAGGFRTFSSLPGTNSPKNAPAGITVSATAFPITVGGGGTGATASPAAKGSNGNTSIFSSITSAGGGAAGTYPGYSCRGPGSAGGSGGGGGSRDAGAGPGGAGNTPPVSPPQGGAGADIPGPPANAYGGGGGGAGDNGCSSTGAIGSFIQDGFIGPTAPSYGEPGPVGSTRYFAGGGGGRPISLPGNGGDGGGANHNGPNCGAGVVNTGGGGGGMYCSCKNGGTGGSGIVIIRYKFQ
jgi:hypothetical protein